MGDQGQPIELTRAQGLWALAATIPFLLSIAFLGYALSARAVLVLAIVWPALQIVGYVGAISRSNGNFSHPLWISQVMIHWTALVLIIALVVTGGPQ